MLHSKLMQGETRSQGAQIRNGRMEPEVIYDGQPHCGAETAQKMALAVVQGEMHASNR